MSRITSIGNEDLKRKNLKDAEFIMIAESGAMGEPGAVYIVKSDGKTLYCNYAYGGIHIKKLFQALPVLQECDFGIFGNAASIPEGWNYVYLGAGNHLLIKDDAYGQFCKYVKIDEDPSEIYARWLDAAFKITDSFNSKQEDTISIEQEIMEEIEAGYDPYEDERVYVTQELVHGDEVPDSIHVKESFFSDGRSYLSEMWCNEHYTGVTFYFPVSDPLCGEIPNDTDIIETFLIRENKIIEGEEHDLGIMIIDTEEGSIFSVTVCVGDDDSVFCEVYM